MIRKIFTNRRNKPLHPKMEALIERYGVPREFLSVNRRSVIRALLVGTFIALIPMPFQMLAVLALSPWIRFNIPIALAMCWLSNPLTMPPMYYVEYLTGCWLLGIEPLAEVQMTVAWFKENLPHIFLPLYTGTFFYAVTLAPALYVTVNRLWIQSVHKARNAKR